MSQTKPKPDQRTLRSFWIKHSWILKREDLKHLKGETVRKIASHWCDFCVQARFDAMVHSVPRF